MPCESIPSHTFFITGNRHQAQAKQGPPSADQKAGPIGVTSGQRRSAITATAAAGANTGTV